MTEWLNRPLDGIYPVVFIDAIHVKIREANGPIYVGIGVTTEGASDILGLWACGLVGVWACGLVRAARAPSIGITF